MKPPTRNAKKVIQRAPTVSKSSWTLREKRKLLQTLATHATLDAEILQHHLPQKTVEEVRSVIRDYMGQRTAKLAAAATLCNNDSKEEKTLEWWLEKCRLELGNLSDSSHFVAAILETLALMEEDAPPFSYGKIYAYLGAAARGLKTMYLQPDEAHLLMQQLKDLAQTVGACDTTRQVAYLRDKYLVPHGAGGPVTSDCCPDLIRTSISSADEAVVTEDVASSSPATRGMPIGVPLSAAEPQSCTVTVSANAVMQAGPNGHGCEASTSHNILAQDAACFTPLVAPAALSSLEQDLLNVKSFNPLGIPYFLLQFHCKPADICSKSVVSKQQEHP